MWRLLIILLQFMSVALSKISIGRFQEYAHGLKGEVILLNERQYMIKGFNYDGRGPAVWHTGMPTGIIGVFSEKSYPFQNDRNNCDRLDKVVRNGEVIVTIPKTLSLSKDIDTLAVYCYRFCHNFGHVKIPKGLKLDPAPPGLPDNPLCKPEYPPCKRDGTRDNGVCMDASGKEVTCPVPKETTTPSSTGSTSPYALGKFEEHAHGVKGEIYLLNERQYMIKGFSYDGLGPAVWQTGMPVGTIGVYSEKSYPFWNEKNNCDRMDKPINNKEITITIPKKYSLSKDIATLAVYCYRFCHNFAHIKIPPGLKLPPAPDNLPDYQLCKPDYPPCTRDATRDNAVCTAPSGTEVTCPVETAKSISIGKFQEYAHGLKGDVFILNERQYMIKNFYYDGAGPAVWHTGMPVGVVGVYSEKSYPFRNDKNNCDRLNKPVNNGEVIITIPKNLRLSKDVGTLAVYCYRFCHNFGHVKIPKDIVIPPAPPNLPEAELCKPDQKPCTKDGTRDNGVCMEKTGAEVTCPVEARKGKGKCLWTKPMKKKRKALGAFKSYENGIAGQVTIINTRQFRIKGFKYNGVKANSTYFLVMEKNTIGIHSVKGSAVPDENEKCNGLKAYTGQDLIITVPVELRTTSIGAISVYDFETCSNFGHVKVPPGITVPDAPAGLPDLRICLPFFRPCSRASTKNNGVCMVKGKQVTC